MKNLNRYLMAGAAIASLSVVTSNTADAAQAYAGLFGGLNLLQNPGLKGHSHTYTTTALTLSSYQSADMSFKTGYVVGGNFGIDWGSGLRTEIELAARGNTSKSHAHLVTNYQYGYYGTIGPYTYWSTDTQVPAHVHLRAYSVMANVWYDFQTDMGFTPYIGGGIGLAQIQIDGSLGRPDFANLDGALTIINLHEKNDTTFAWQVGAGISVPITDGIKASLDYRYFSAHAAKLKLEPGFQGGNVNADFDSHDIMIGLRFNL